MSDIDSPYSHLFDDPDEIDDVDPDALLPGASTRGEGKVITTSGRRGYEAGVHYPGDQRKCRCPNSCLVHPEMSK